MTENDHENWDAAAFGHALEGYACLGIGLIVAGVIALNSLSSAADAIGH